MGVARAGPQQSFVQQTAARIESLFDRPIVDVNEVQKMTDTTYAAPNSPVSRLLKLGEADIKALEHDIKRMLAEVTS